MSAFPNPPGLDWWDRWDLETALKLLYGTMMEDYEDDRIDGDYVLRWHAAAVRRLDERKKETA